MRPLAAATVLIALPLALVLASGSVVRSATGGHKTHRSSQHGDDTDVTGTIQSSKPVATGDTPAPPADDATLPVPFRLPVASRERMRSCGMKWQEMKMAGTAGSDTWREFATVCLAEQGPQGASTH